MKLRNVYGLEMPSNLRQDRTTSGYFDCSRFNCAVGWNVNIKWVTRLVSKTGSQVHLPVLLSLPRNMAS